MTAHPTPPSSSQAAATWRADAPATEQAIAQQAATSAAARRQGVVTVPLYRLAHSRSGDKGDISNLSLVAWTPACFEVLVEQVTPERVAAWFGYRRPRAVHRYLLPGLESMNLVLEGVLDGGVNDALNLDTHGKALAFWLLDMPVEVDEQLAAALPDVTDPSFPASSPESSNSWDTTPRP